jgi:hypothetical protein
MLLNKNKSIDCRLAVLWISASIAGGTPELGCFDFLYS